MKSSSRSKSHQPQIGLADIFYHCQLILMLPDIERITDQVLIIAVRESYDLILYNNNLI